MNLAIRATWAAQKNNLTESVVLKDLLLDVETNLGNNPTYSFNHTPGKNSNRFVLIFSAVGLDENQTTANTMPV